MIDFKKVSKVYKRNDGEVKALDRVSLQIPKGEIYGIIGYSGAGKSTLIRLINYLEEPTDGVVSVDGVDLSVYTVDELRKTRQQIGMIFQHFNLLESKTIFDNIALPLILANFDKKRIAERVYELLDFVGLREKAKSYPNELSGGQKQRIGIARALALNPSILLCDEATSALDPETTESILRLLKRINEEYGITIVMVTHEMGIIQKICHQVAVMEDGQVIENGDVIEVFGAPQHPSTKDFVKMIIDDKVPENIQRKAAKKGTRLFTFAYEEQRLNQAIQQAIRRFPCDFNLVFSSLNDIKEQTLGFVTYELSGDDVEVNQAIEFFKNEGHQIKEVMLDV